MAPGENYVPMHAYRFNRDAIDNLIHDLRTFGTEGGSSPVRTGTCGWRWTSPVWSIQPFWMQRSNASDQSAPEPALQVERFVTHNSSIILTEDPCLLRETFRHTFSSGGQGGPLS